MNKSSGTWKFASRFMVAVFALMTFAANPAWAFVAAPVSSVRLTDATPMVTNVVHGCRFGHGGYYRCPRYGYLPFYYHHHHHWAHHDHHWAVHDHFGGFGHGGFGHGAFSHGGFGHGGHGHHE